MGTLNQIALLLGGWTIIFSTILYFISNRIADKLNIKWKESSEKNITILQSQLTKNNNSLSHLISLYGTSYHQAQERRIKAIEVLWINLLQFKGTIPSTGHLIYNILSDDEIEAYWKKETNNKNFLAGQNILLNINEIERSNKILALITEIEKERPFIGENIWLYYDIYKTFIGRIGFLLINGTEKRYFKHWHKDSLINSLFDKTLTPEE